MSLKESTGQRIVREWWDMPGPGIREKLAEMIDQAIGDAHVCDSLSGAVAIVGHTKPADDITPREAALLSAAVALRGFSVQASSTCLSSTDSARAVMAMLAEIRREKP